MAFVSAESTIRAGDVSNPQVAHIFKAITPKGVNPNDGFGVGVAFDGANDDLSEGPYRYGEIRVIFSDVSDDTEDSYMEIRTAQAGILGHADIRSKDNPSDLTASKVIRLNVRNYLQTSGDAIGIQVKPRLTQTSTGEVRGAEISPSISSGFGAASLTGVFADCYLRGSGAGTVTVVRAVQAQIEDDVNGGTNGTKTLSLVAAYTASQALSTTQTVSSGPHVLQVYSVAESGSAKQWESFVRFTAAGAAASACYVGAMTAKNPEDDAEAGYLSIMVGSTRYEIPFYAVA